MTSPLVVCPRPPDPPPYLPLGDRLRAGRHAIAGLSVALLAAAVEVTPATIYQYDAGHRRPRRTTLTRLATVLALDADELTALAGYPSRPSASADPPDGRSAPQ